MKFLLRLLLPAAVIFAGVPSNAVAICSSDVEQQALNTRVFQSELMVAALACNQQKQYNKFVVKFEPLLVERGKGVRAFFTRNYGGRAEKALNRFVTRIANDAASRGLETEESAYCEHTSQRFNQILTATPRQIDAIMSQDVSSLSHGVVACDDDYHFAETAAN